MRKSESLVKWRSMEKDQPILKHFEPIPYKSSGSSYGACGIRIDGSPAFIDSVMSHLTELIAGENNITRLELARSVVKPKPGKSLDKACSGAECLYIRLHMRSDLGSAVSSVFDKDLRAASEKYASAIAD